MAHSRLQSTGEEVANSVTHGIGFVASLVGLPVVVAAATTRNDVWQLVGNSVFAVTLVLLYAASTLYHALPRSRAKQVVRVIDHAAIYLLIAGTYTPFTLGVLRGSWGWTLFGVVWALAVAGIAFKTACGVRFGRLSTAAYLLMGWVCLVAIRPITLHVPPAGLAWMVAGGVLYSSGVVFYAWERLRYGHAVWHLFVLLGSACHFFAVLWYAA